MYNCSIWRKYFTDFRVLFSMFSSTLSSQLFDPEVSDTFLLSRLKSIIAADTQRKQQPILSAAGKLLPVALTQSANAYQKMY